MNAPTSLFLAWRYFKPKRDAVSVITLISVVGVSLGVCVLMVVLAIMTGFTDEMKAKLLETTAHIQVRSATSAHMDDPRQVVQAARSLGCEAVPVIEGPVLVQAGRRILAMAVIGVDPGEDGKDFVSRHIVEGAFPSSPGHVLVSDVMASSLGLSIGSRLALHSPHKLGRMMELDESGAASAEPAKLKTYLPDEFRISGIYSIGKYDFDSKFLVCNLDDADELFGCPWGVASSVHIHTKDPFDLAHTAAALRRMLPGKEVRTWKEINRQLLDVLAVEKNMMFFVLVFIVLVAAFSIANTLITVVVQKTREIGLLRAIGAGRGTVMLVFILQGFLVGFIGTLAGMGLGLAVVTWRMPILRALSAAFGIEIFPKQIYMFSELPASIVPADVAVVAACSLALCTLGAVVPALRAARLDPAAALRYE